MNLELMEISVCDFDDEMLANLQCVLLLPALVLIFLLLNEILYADYA